MQAEKPTPQPEDLEARKRHVALELVFISFLGIAVLGAFMAALSYSFVSARAPMVIIVPLLLLIGYQFEKTRRRAEAHLVREELAQAIAGRIPAFNSVVAFIGWMVLLLLMIYIAGHYAGILAFMLILLRRVSRESWTLSLLISIGVTILIYALFEHGFKIELYRGYIFRLLAGYA